MKTSFKNIFLLSPISFLTDLQAVLDEIPRDHLTFLTTKLGSPFTAAGFTNWFRKACNEAGLQKGISAHGLRKAAARRLAEAGCSMLEIASITGHASLSEIQRYTKSADQKRLARKAIEAVSGGPRRDQNKNQTYKPR